MRDSRQNDGFAVSSKRREGVPAGPRHGLSMPQIARLLATMNVLPEIEPKAR